MTDDEESILVQMNKGFQELRTLILTVGSILAMLMAGLNEVGFIEWAVDSLLDRVEDDPDWNPYLDDCGELWEVETDYFIVESDVVFNVQAIDLNSCNNVHTILWNITLGDEVRQGQSHEFRNQLLFTERFYDLEEGTYHALIEIMNGTIELYDYRIIDFELDESEYESAVYGCTDYDATNYDEEATHDDGTCEYPDVIADDCDPAVMVFYDAYAFWSNNTTLSTAFDADVDMECRLNATAYITVYDNETGEVITDYDYWFETYHMDWDYRDVNFTGNQEDFAERELMVEWILESETGEVYAEWVSEVG